MIVADINCEIKFSLFAHKIEVRNVRVKFGSSPEGRSGIELNINV
jgi:hypothetical protein